jgi:hypothetical protein
MFFDVLKSKMMCKVKNGLATVTEAPLPHPFVVYITVTFTVQTMV